MILLNIAFAMTSGGSQTGQQSGGDMIHFLIILGLVFIIFYFLLMRPQKKQQQALQEMRNKLRVGDKVMTSGGIFGIVESVSQDTIMLKVADKVKIEILKSAIAQLREGGKKGKKT